MKARSTKETIRATGTDDLVIANAQNNLIYAGDGDDVIFAGAGNDMIFDGDGSDILNGGAGLDTYIMQQMDSDKLTAILGDRAAADHDVIVEMENDTLILSNFVHSVIDILSDGSANNVDHQLLLSQGEISFGDDSFTINLQQEVNSETNHVDTHLLFSVNHVEIQRYSFANHEMTGDDFQGLIDTNNIYF